jgi:hypothetical protein
MACASCAISALNGPWTLSTSNAAAPQRVIGSVGRLVARADGADMVCLLGHPQRVPLCGRALSGETVCQLYTQKETKVSD